MINPFHEITTTQDDDFEEFLKRIHLFEIFKPAYIEFQDLELFKGIVKFIAWGYSINSDMLNTSGNTWSKVAEMIYEKAELPRTESDDVYHAVYGLKSDGVREAIERWLNFQNEEAWMQFIHYRDLRREFLSLSLSDMKKSTGEIDIEAKMKAALYSKDLLHMMEDAKDTFIQNNSKLKASVEAFNKANTKDKMSRSAGSYALQ